MNERICQRYQSKEYLLEPKLFVGLIGIGGIRYKIAKHKFALILLSI